MGPNFDLVVLGGGSGGYAAALRAAQLGLSVALVEKDKVGGTCLHRGCIPTKAMLHAAEVADAARTGSRLGVHSSIDKIDLAGVTSYAEEVVGRLYRGLTGLIAARKITVIAGAGRLTAGVELPEVVVGDQRVRGSHLVLATGSAPRGLSGVTVDGNAVLTSEEALRLTTLPESAIVLGGGVIGVEFASAWRSFGVQASILEAQPRLLPAEEPELSAGLQRAFRRRGIAVTTSAVLDRCEPASDGGVRVTVAGGRELAAEILLVAVGRSPHTGGMGFEDAGITLDRGGVLVDERLATTAAGVYAVADLVPGLQLAHRGFAHGVFVAEEIGYRRGLLEHPPVPVRDRDIPRVTYSDPEVASVGLGEAAAREQYGEITTVTYDLAGNGRSQLLHTSGLVKLVRVVDGPVVGAHLVGARVSELIGEAQLITAWDAFPSDVAALPHAHPTQHEALGEAHLALAGKPLHLHG